MFNRVTISLSCLLSSLSFANAVSEGVPNKIWFNHDGRTYVRLESGNNTSNCYNSVNFGSHRIEHDDPAYEKKMSLILVAYSTKKRLRLIDIDPVGTNRYCEIDSLVVDD